MQIEEVIRSCSSETVAAAAVACIGGEFAPLVRKAAKAGGMGTGAFTVLSVRRFAEHGDEAEMRWVAAGMDGAQEPVLIGLHRILAIMIASGMAVRGTPQDARQPRPVIHEGRERSRPDRHP